MENNDIKMHDPLIKQGEDGYYYCFSTDTNLLGVQISRSKDLLHWELYKTALSEVPEEVSLHVGKTNFWAPEVIKEDGEYRLYFCASQFGTSQSIIGLATSKQLSGDYVYKGAVIKTYHTGLLELPNAIDPNVVKDREGNAYLVYGSFFGGIYIVKLNKEGFIAERGYGKCIAGGKHRAIEGGYILYNQETDYFYLFISCGSLTYDYNIRVGRAKNIEGPYKDSLGYELTNLDPILSVGDKIAGGYNFDLPLQSGVMALGHNSILELKGEHYVVHHARPEGKLDWPFLQIRRLFWSKDGQAYISPYVGTSNELKLPTKREILGDFSIIRHDRFNNGVTYGRKLKLEQLQYSYSDSEGSLVLWLYEKEYRGKAFIEDDNIYISAISQEGECLWAIKQ